MQLRRARVGSSPRVPVYVEKRLGVVVVGREVAVFKRPRGRDAACVHDLLEVALAQPKQRGAINLGISADEVMKLRD